MKPTLPVAFSLRMVVDPSAWLRIAWIFVVVSSFATAGADASVGMAARPAPTTVRAMPCLRNFTMVPSRIFPRCHGGGVHLNWGTLGKNGRAHVWTPVTNAHTVCRLMLEHKKE